MAYVAAARSIFRSASGRNAVSRLASGAAKPARSLPRAAINRPLSQRIFRSPVELCACAETMLPYHTATSSALMTSMLSISRRSYGWLPDGRTKTR